MATAEADLKRDPAPRENLIRAMPRGYELRHGDSGMPTLHGHFLRTNEWTEIDSMWEGRFMERIAPGAAKKTIRENRSRMRVLFNHGSDPSIGDKVLGAISDLREDDEGAYYEVDLHDTSYVRDLLPGLEAGQYGASFRFRVMREDWNDSPGESDWNPEGLPERTIKELSVMEFGPVTFPAYEGATAGVRSLTDQYMVGRFVSEPKRLRELIETHVPERNAAGVETPAPSEPTPADATSDTERREQHTTPEAEQERDTVEANHDIDRFTTVEQLATRKAEIGERRKYIDAEWAGKQFPEDVQQEWNDLNTEEGLIDERVKHLNDRKAVLEARMSKPEARVEGSQPATFAAPRNKVERIYDLAEYRKNASGPEDEARLLRDGLKRSLDETHFAHPKVRRDEAQAAVEKTVNTPGLDRQGSLSAYLLAVGSDTYRKAFGKWAISGGMAPMDAQEQHSVQQARAYEERAFTLGSTGLPVPYQLDPTIIPISNSSVNPFRAISRIVQTTVNEWRGATSGAVTAAYAAEGTEASDNTPTLTQPVIPAVRAQAFVPLSIEVAQDWGVVEQEMAALIADAKDDLEATKFTLGTGTNEPTGIIPGATMVVTTTTGAFVVADLYKLEEALPPRFRPRASMVANRAILNKVRQFDSAGGSANWLPYPGVGQGLNNQVPTPGNVGYGILAYPTYENSAMDAVLTTGSEIIAMGDFNNYVIVDRVGMSIDLIPHLFGATNRFPTGQRGLYAFWRTGGEKVAEAPFRVLQT